MNDDNNRCPHGMFYTGAGACPACEGSMDADDEKPVVKLLGEDGNAFAIMSRCVRAARKAGWSKEKRQKVIEEMQSSNYDNLLITAMKYFDVE